MSSAAERAVLVRRGVGLFPDLARGLVEVTGGDRERWLNGMITADVAALEPGPSRSGHYALLLTPKGRILADLQVIARGDRFWLDTDAAQQGALTRHLDRYRIADDVELLDVSADWTRIGLEGPDAPTLVSKLAGRDLLLTQDSVVDSELGGVTVAVGAWGSSGECAFRLFVPPAARDSVLAAIRAADAALVEGDAETLEVLRIEAGVPRVGAELDEEVFPAEAGLVERAVSLSKGCFTGQEIVARLHSRGKVNHRLVGLRFEGDAAPEVGAPLALADGKVVGEITSGCVASSGAIGLGFARLPHDAPGTRLLAGSRAVTVAERPLVAPRVQ